MRSISTIGLDIAKSVFQVHGVDAAGQIVLRWQLKRRQVVGTSSFAQGCTGQLTTVEVERFNGNLMPIRAFDPI